MSSPKGESGPTVRVRLTVGGVSVVLSGPRDWVDEHLDRFLSAPAFSLESARQAPTSGTAPVPMDARFAPHFARWMVRHGVTADQVDQVLHVQADGAVVIAATLPGVGRQRVTAAYLLQGLAAFATGEASRFQDRLARELLTRHDAYDAANHATYVKEGLKGRLIGDKETGFLLSIPGQTEAAKLVKQIAGASTTNSEQQGA